MNGPPRLALLLFTALLALGVAGSALAAYQPRLLVKNPSERLGATTALTIRVEQPKEDDATFRLALYVPTGYGLALTQAPGTQVGSVAAHAQANAISPDAILELTGAIQLQPYSAATFPQGAACAGTAAIDSVLVLVLTAAGQTLQVPMYASRAEGAEATFAQAKLTACLPSPYVPQAQGGAAFGAKLIDAELSFTGVFTNPGGAGDYRWSGVWTPYTVGTPTPNATGTVETQSIDRLAAQLTLSARTRARTVTLSGTLLENGNAVPRARVQLLLGRTAGVLRAAGTATTNGRGAFATTLRNRAKGVWFARARVTVGERAAPCQSRFAPAPCLSSNVGGFSVVSNRVIRFRI